MRMRSSMARQQQPPALLIGLVELLLQLVAEGHQVGPNSGKTNSHIRFCHHWVADLGWEQVEQERRFAGQGNHFHAYLGKRRPVGCG